MLRRRRWAVECAVVVGVGAALAVVMTWPALRDPTRTVPGDLGDPLIVSWALAWAGHALATDPAQLWHANVFYPDRYTFAYTDTLLGYAPAGLFGAGPEAALLRYNVLFTFAYALSFVGAYALTRQLGATRLAAAIAGAAWAFGPWRLAQAGHLHVLSAGGVAVCLAMLARGHGWSLRHGYRPRRRRPGWAFAGWSVAAWQVTLGFGIGLPLVYVLLGACMAAAAAYGRAWWRRTRPPFGRRLLLADVAGGALFAAVTLGMAAVYQRVNELDPRSVRTPDLVPLFSPPLRGLVTAPAESWLWGERHAAARAGLPWPPEMTLLPGMTLIGLAVTGLFLSRFRPRHRALLAVGVLATAALALGANLGADGDPGYLTLSAHLPGWNALRTPGRLMVWTSLLLAVLAAGAASAVADLARRAGPRWAASTARAALLVPLALVLAEGVPALAHPAPPPAPAAFRAAPEPMLLLPLDASVDFTAMFWSTDRFPRMPNGVSGFVPARQDEVRAATATFPDPVSVAYLRRIGVRTVLVFRDRVSGTPWHTAPDRDVHALGIGRQEIEGVVVFHLG